MSLYLKQCAVSLQQYYADSRFRDERFSVSVSLSRAGIPTIIPTHHRHIIMQRGERGDRLVRLYLSWFSLCRVVPLAKRIRKSLFDSIVVPPTCDGCIKEVCRLIRASAPDILPLYIPWISEIPMTIGISWVPTWKSTPNSDKRVLSLDVELLYSP